jgi:hypothetical protein
MPVKYRFSKNLFIVTLKGSYTPEEMMTTFLKALNDPSFPENAQFLMDVRESAELGKRDAGVIKAVAEFFASHSERVGHKCAIVAAKPAHYGQSRMAAAFAEIDSATVEVFTEVDDAISWLKSVHHSSHRKRES